MTDTLGLERLPNRCSNGYDLGPQHRFCTCTEKPADEWSIFQAAVRRATRPDGTVSNNDLRPHIQAIPHKHRGLMYRRATSAGLLRLIPDRSEPSTDSRGKNTDKSANFYAVRSAA